MSSKKKIRSFTTIGFSSILIVFVMLALVTFTVLSVLTANADYRLSKKVADKTTAYYSANSSAELILSDIDSRLLVLYQDTGSSERFFAGLKQALADVEGLTVSEPEEDTKGTYYLVSYTSSISDTQYLDIELALRYPASRNDSFYTINKWQTVTDTSNLNTSQTLHLQGK